MNCYTDHLEGVIDKLYSKRVGNGTAKKHPAESRNIRVNGKYLDEFVLRQGVSQYLEEWYSDCSQLKIARKYTNGVADGEWKEWYRSGVLKSYAMYANGLYSGDVKEWSETAILLSHCVYDNGVLLSSSNYKQ